MKITSYVLNLLRKKPSKQKNTVKIDDELEREIDTLKELNNTVKENTKLTYERIDQVKEIINQIKELRNELERQTKYDNYNKYPICLKNEEIDLSEIDD